MPVNDNESGGNFVLESDHMSMFNIFLMFFFNSKFWIFSTFFQYTYFQNFGGKIQKFGNIRSRFI